MAAEEFNPSRCEIVKALVTPHGDGKEKFATSIIPLIGGFTISQSMSSTAIRMTIDCYDGIGLLENLPLRGEEEIELEIKCYDFQDSLVRLRGQIFKIDNVEPTAARNAVIYTLHVMSKTSYSAALHQVIRAFRNVHASKMVEDLFVEYFSAIELATNEEKEELPYEAQKYNIKNSGFRKFYLQPTEGLLKLTIPRYTPSEAIYWIAKKSFSKSSPSCSFRFFENFDGFHFVTDEFLIAKAVVNKKVKELNYGAFTTLDPREGRVQVTHLEEMSNKRRVDVGQEIGNGAYYNAVVELDLNNHTSKRYNFNYIDEINNKKFTTMSNKPPTLATDIHSKEFIEQTFSDENAKQYMIFRDYDTDEGGGKGPVVRGEQFYRQIVQNRSTYSAHLAATQVTAKIKGRLDIQCGEVVYVNARKFNVSNESVQNEQLSGRYLVFAVTHNVEEGVLTTELALNKYDWSKE